MRKLLFIFVLLVSLSLLAFAQDVKPITISAEQVALIEITRLRARVAVLESRVAALESEKAATLSRELGKVAEDTFDELLKKIGIKKEDIEKYDITPTPDGGREFKLKEEKK